MKIRKLILYCALLQCSNAFAQTEFLFEKEKSLEHIPHSSYPTPIEWTNDMQGIVYAPHVSENQHTVSYTLRLPHYTQGIFFTTDIFPNQWPNNTNRLLPWHFSHIHDIIKKDYPGIPSNNPPSPLGDAILLQISNDRFLFLKSLSSTHSLSWFAIEPNGTLKVYISTLGKAYLKKENPLFLSMESNNIYETLQTAYDALCSNHKVSFLRKRDQKPYFEAFSYLGWCTWENYHFDIDEKKNIKRHC